MGNGLKAVQDPSRPPRREKAQAEDLLLSKLSGLQEVELWRVQWGLSQNLLQDFPPIPAHWLRSADASSTGKTMLRCYHEDGALTVLDAVLTRIGPDWVRPLNHAVDPPRPVLALRPDPDLVRTRRRKLISRIQWLDAVLDPLQKYGILTATNRDAIQIYQVHKQKNRALVDLVLRKGSKAQELFCKALSQSEPFLLQELEDSLIMDKNPSETSVLAEMLEFLVSEELRTFQWLVRDHMTEESLSPAGGEQLQHADRPTTERLLGKHLGPKQAESVTMNVLLKVVPTLGVCLGGEAMTSQTLSDIRVDKTEVEVTPEVFQDGAMFRLRCQRPGVFRCGLTGLLLEGLGDLVYQMVPWDVDFLSSKGLRPAGPLYRFTLLTGSFHRLHLPHCQPLSGERSVTDESQHFLSVAHITGDCVDFITPAQVTDSHVIINISGFSCFGLVTPVESGDAISSLVLLFSQLSKASLFVLLLPRNICLTQVLKTWQRRVKAEYVETIPDCELIPNQLYKLSGQPVTLIQPQSSKFVNFSDYNNFLPSFHLQLAADVRRVELQLKSHVTSLPLIGWLYESVVWHQVVHLRAAASTLCSQGLVDVTLLLLHMLDCLGSEDFKKFQHLLSRRSDPIPVCRLEAADRTRTVDLMVQQYHTEGAKQVTKEILKMMDHNQLADQL